MSGMTGAHDDGGSFPSAPSVSGKESLSNSLSLEEESAVNSLMLNLNSVSTIVNISEAGGRGGKGEMLISPRGRLSASDDEGRMNSGKSSVAPGDGGSQFSESKSVPLVQPEKDERIEGHSLSAKEMEGSVEEERRVELEVEQEAEQETEQEAGQGKNVMSEEERLEIALRERAERRKEEEERERRMQLIAAAAVEDGERKREIISPQSRATHLFSRELYKSHCCLWGRCGE